jgi:hypothetical protein
MERGDFVIGLLGNFRHPRTFAATDKYHMSLCSNQHRVRVHQLKRLEMANDETLLSMNRVKLCRTPLHFDDAMYCFHFHPHEKDS